MAHKTSGFPVKNLAYLLEPHQPYFLAQQEIECATESKFENVEVAKRLSVFEDEIEQPSEGSLRVAT
jgi:hypothetical protein